MRQENPPVGEVELEKRLLNRADALRRRLEMRIPARLQPEVSADDILQEVWVAAFRDISALIGQRPDAFDRWLVRVAERKLLGAIRRTRALKRGGYKRALRDAIGRLSSLSTLWDRVASPGRTPSRTVAAKEAVDAVQIALSTLPEQDRRAIRLRYLEGRSLAETATAMAKSPAAVNSLLFRGRRRLRRCLGHAAKFFSDAKDSRDPIQ